MKFLKIMLASIMVVCVPVLSHAGEDPMSHCPRMNEVRIDHFDFAQSTNGIDWMVGKYRSRFGTNFSWMFAITLIKATDKSEAFIKAKDATNYLAFKKADKDTFSCHYYGTYEGREIEGVALKLT